MMNVKSKMAIIYLEVEMTQRIFQLVNTNISTIKFMFSGSSYTTRLQQTVPDVRIGGENRVHDVRLFTAKWLDHSVLDYNHLENGTMNYETS